MYFFRSEWVHLFLEFPDKEIRERRAANFSCNSVVYNWSFEMTTEFLVTSEWMDNVAQDKRRTSLDVTGATLDICLTWETVWRQWGSKFLSLETLSAETLTKEATVELLIALFRGDFPSLRVVRAPLTRFGLVKMWVEVAHHRRLLYLPPLHFERQEYV